MARMSAARRRQFLARLGLRSRGRARSRRRNPATDMHGPWLPASAGKGDSVAQREALYAATEPYGPELPPGWKRDKNGVIRRPRKSKKSRKSASRKSASRKSRRSASRKSPARRRRSRPALRSQVQILKKIGPRLARVKYRVRRGRNRGKTRVALRVLDRNGRVMAPRRRVKPHRGRFRHLNPGIGMAIGLGVLAFPVHRVVSGLVGRIGPMNSTLFGSVTYGDLASLAAVAAPLWLHKGLHAKLGRSCVIGITAGAAVSALLGNFIVQKLGIEALASIPGFEASAIPAATSGFWASATGAYIPDSGMGRYGLDNGLDGYVRDNGLNGYVQESESLSGLGAIRAALGEDAADDIEVSALEPHELAAEGLPASPGSKVVRASSVTAQSLISTGAARNLGPSKSIPGTQLIEVRYSSGDPRGLLPLQTGDIPVAHNLVPVTDAAGQDVGPAGLFGRHIFQRGLPFIGTGT